MKSLRATCALCVCAASLTLATAPAHAQTTDTSGATSQRWLDRRISADERAAFDAMIGYAPPAIPASLPWIPAASDALDAPPDQGAPTWESLRGKVVVLQSWTSRTAIGRSTGSRVVSQLRAMDSRDVYVLLLHMPDGAESAKAYLERSPLAAPVLVDADGVFGAALGISKHPINILIDRNGAVRYAALTPDGMVAAVRSLVTEPFDPAKQPEPMPAPAPVVTTPTPEPPAPAPANAAAPAAWPPQNTGDFPASNMQGKRAPTLEVEAWISSPVETEGKLLVIDFWATWCGPCVASIPHMSQLARQFDGKAVFIGLSNEKKFEVENFRRNGGNPKMEYAVAIDSKSRLASWAGVKAIPHILVIAPDGVVRWQGSPHQLTPALMQSLVNASAAPAAPSPPSENGKSPATPAPSAAGPTFPPHNAEGGVNARNVQGMQAPPLEFGQFVTAPAETNGKVVIVDFWATWCGPCVRAIPHMNALAETFKDSVAVIGVSDEPLAKVKAFTADEEKPKMNYSVASDPKRTLISWAEPNGIPHVLVISPDGVVRWQGHPGRLTGAIVKQIVDASGVAPKPAPAEAEPSRKQPETTRPAAPSREKAPARKPASAPRLTPSKP